VFIYICVCMRVFVSCSYFVVALALSTGCSVFGIELVEERHVVAKSLLDRVWQALWDEVQLPEDCGQPDCVSIRTRLAANMTKYA
jgi:hypothetical protein